MASSIHEHNQNFHSIKTEISTGQTSQNTDIANFDLDGWIGGDYQKLRIKSEGEIVEGKLNHSELWGMYSKNISEFWDADFGVRQDSQPVSRSYLVIGIQGLAKYFFETEAHIFFSDEEEITARFYQENELLITQKLISKFQLNIDLSNQKIEEQEIGKGLTKAEIGLQTRYEITRNLAPYLEMKYERKFGGTSNMARDVGEDVDEAVISLGVAFIL